MPLKNKTFERTYPFRIAHAEAFFPRLLGLLGTSRPDLQKGLYFNPCSGIHTFGMQYPVDVLYLDENGCVVNATSNLKANAVSRVIPIVKSVLELPPGSISRHDLRVGDRLDVVPDEKHRASLASLKNVFHWPLNGMIALLWGRFVVSALSNWIQLGGALNLGILVHNTLLCVLFLTRRKSVDTSHHVVDWFVPIGTLISAMMLRSGFSVSYPIDIIAVGMQCAGMALIVLSLLSLGRSFGIVPANRKVKYTGAYRIVRHPLYASELVFYAGFFIGNFSLRNGILIGLILIGQIWRSIREERLLSKDPVYDAYRKHVRFRLVPGLY